MKRLARFQNENHKLESFFLPYQDASVHCLRFGHGPQLLLALHGFGDRARMFAVLEPDLAAKYTVVAIDWPFHGQTDWPRQSFQKSDLLAILNLVLEKEAQSRFSLMGFSFGGRLAQSMLPELVDRLDKLYLLSPDGIETVGMTLAVRTPLWLRKFLYRLLKRPHWFLNLLRWGNKIGLVPGLINHFLACNLSRPDRFQRTFGCWLSLDSFYLRRRHIKALLKSSGLPTSIYYGERDEMINFKKLKKMTQDLPNVQLRVLPEGHRLIGPQLGASLGQETFKSSC